MMYTVDPSVDEPIMLIDRHIGNDDVDGYGIMGDTFQQELLQLDGMGKKCIQVWINSKGGDVDQGFNIYNAILKTKTPVDTYCVGIAASIAGVIFQAGRKRIMNDYGILMYHNPAGAPARILDVYKNSLVKMVANRSGKPEDEVSKMMNRETWISADEAKDMGLCDEVHQSVDFNKKHWKQVSNSNNEVLIWKESNKVLNKILNKNRPMLKVTNKLGLTNDASEDSILAAIEKVTNSAAEAQARATELETEKAEKEKELVEVQNKLNELQAEKDQLEADKKAADEVALNEKATTMVTNFAKAGRIKNDAGTIAKWVSKAKADFDGTKELIEELPVNSQSIKIPVTNSVETPGKGKGNYVAKALAAVKTKNSK